MIYIIAPFIFPRWSYKWEITMYSNQLGIAFLPVYEIGDAVALRRKERLVFPAGVEVVDWFHRYYVRLTAIFDPQSWAVTDPLSDR
jgi:hypothetical protein